jgi:uncharacterized damage-inducible protein DinB
MFADLKQYLDTWESEANRTLQVLEALPESKYDFRPDPAARSLGEMAWHLAEIDAYMTTMIEKGSVAPGEKPPGIERPKTIAALAPGYRRIHADAVARVKKLTAADLDRKVKFFDNSDITIRKLLWGPLFCHLIHHRGQLMLLTRLAGGKVPGIYGPNREMTEEMKARAS